MNAPKRAITIKLEIGADDMRELRAAFEHILYCTERGSTTVTSGGYGWGGNWSVECNPDMTHDVYFAATEAWLAEQNRMPKIHMGLCTRCGAELNNVSPGISVVAGGSICATCLRPGETELLRAR
jgi:hypothetical protein